MWGAAELMHEHLISILSNIGVLSFVALSAYLLLLTGAVSFGQQAFFALGGYSAGVATAMWGWPLALGLAFGAAVAAFAALLVSIPTLPLEDLHFSIASLAFAEVVRVSLEMLHYQVLAGGELIGPAGVEGFRGIKALFEMNLSSAEVLVLIWAALVVVVALFFILERSRFGLCLRTIGEDQVLAKAIGIPSARYKVLTSGIAGAIAGLGGGFYAHLTTYVEPRTFDIMLGVHALAYGLIGGLGTAIGPLLGVFIDVGLLESTRWFAGYRMIVFGGLVAVLLIIRPRGLLDEAAVNRIKRIVRNRRRRAGATR